jgi:long-chain acyl-CoA synthetase
MNIYPDDLEAALRRQPEVKDCVVIALPREGNAEPCAVIILRDKQADPEPVVRRANQTLAEYQQMRSWMVWPDDDFPRTSTQKPRTQAIREVVLAQPDSKASLNSGPGSLAELIARVKGEVPRNSHPETNLDADLNLSSLDRVELLGALEERYQQDFSETRFAALNTVADLEAMLRGNSSPPAHYHYPAWVQHWPTTWIRLIAHYVLLRPAVFLLGRLRVTGRENLRGLAPPVLVVCNHIDDVDVGFVQAALPFRFRHHLATATAGEALEKLRTPPPGRKFFGRTYDRLKWVLGVSLLNLFPLPREAGFRESFAFAGETVDRGFSILVFPEGCHTADGKLGPFRAGVGLLANNLAIPIVPMRIEGLFELKKRKKKIAWGAGGNPIHVTIGAPVRFPADTDPQWIASQLQAAVENLSK